MNIPKIETPNLILRPFTEADSGPMHQILSGRDVLRYFPDSSPLNLERVQRMIRNLLEHWQKYGYGLWAVESRANGQLIGRGGLQYIEETDEVEVDFILGNPFWGHGFATEIGKSSLKYGFENLMFDTIVGIVHPGNSASQRVLEKIGMHFTKEKEYFGMACFRYAVDKEMSPWANI